jgi:hypothetical protein
MAQYKIRNGCPCNYHSIIIMSGTVLMGHKRFMYNFHINIYIRTRGNFVNITLTVKPCYQKQEQPSNCTRTIGNHACLQNLNNVL